MKINSFAALLFCPSGPRPGLEYRWSEPAQLAEAKPTALAVFTWGIAVLVFFSFTGRSATAQSGEWSWENGNSLHAPTSVTGVYGTLGIASPANTPSGRDSSTTWTDTAGNLWLFGGAPGGNFLALGPSLNDLWKFDPSTAQWTWESGGSSDVALAGTYGQLGVPSKTNVPGSRAGGLGWVDPSDNLWLFGGSGYDSVGNLGVLDDLWRFNPLAAEWTWMGGHDIIPPNPNQCIAGSYGTLGLASAANLPGARAYSGAWTDSSGTFWLFGGEGCGASGGPSLLNDLWNYSPATSLWTWMGGSTTSYTSGIYNSFGMESSASFPGSRYMFANWTDSSGRFWMFGGFGLDVIGALGSLNDLWRFDPATGNWAYISGSDVIGNQNCSASLGLVGCSQSSVYGTLGQASPDNVPGGRVEAVGAATNDGNFLLFGGSNQAGNIDNSAHFTNDLNDLWQFNPVTAQWAWIGGSDMMACGASSQGKCLADGEPGAYGTQRVASTVNYPGSREGHVSWADGAGNFWIFGGDGFDCAGINPQLNDIWEYRVPPLVAPVAATVTLVSSASPVFTQNPVTLTAHVSIGVGGRLELPTGTVTFLQGNPNDSSLVSLGSAAVDTSGRAALILASLPVGAYTIVANYSGDTNNLAATSSSINQVAGDFSLAANAPASATVASGGSTVFNFSFAPLGPIKVFPAAIGLTASGGPAGATYVFSPASLAKGSAAASVTLTVTTPAPPATAASRAGSIRPRWPIAPALPFALAGLLLPFARLRSASQRSARLRSASQRSTHPSVSCGEKRSTRPTLPALLFLMVVGLGSALALGGCGNRFHTVYPTIPYKPPVTPTTQTYTLTIVGASGPLSHSATVTLVAN